METLTKNESCHLLPFVSVCFTNNDRSVFLPIRIQKFVTDARKFDVLTAVADAN